MMIRNCVICSKEFEADKPTRKYCSRECYHKKPVWNKGTKGLQVAWNKTEWPMLKCEHCEKDYSAPPNQAIRSRFCSRLCQNRWIAVNKKRLGPENGMYKTGNSPKHYRREAFLIYGEKCNRCGELELKKLVVHHVDENRNNNPLDGSNWEILCRKCHQLHHECQSNLPKEPRPVTLYKHHCKMCSIPFENRSRKSYYCSHKCYTDDTRKHQPTTKECLYCKKSFVASKEHRKYCSPSCSNKYRASI